ncbi:hypothetical protein KR044_006097 [Drosophila immigrans]|nr:hypothetical protein KR044_006097 [Drosophila immigrans]
MVCAKCEGKSAQSAKCILSALDTLKAHFLMMQGVCEDNANTITLLKQRNEKLHNAIDLLQQQKRYVKCSPKRRRPSPKKPRFEKMPQTESPKVPESQSSLNMNIALQSDDEEDESITETEPPKSPYKPWPTRRKLIKTNCENEQPEVIHKTDTKTEWLSKLPKDKLPAPKTKLSLTLRSDSPKLKQTRLQFDANATRNAGPDKDVIESSPNLYSTLRHAKQSRSLLQRADNSNAFDAGSIASTSAKSVNENQPVFDMEEDDSFFDLCPDPSAPKPVADLPSLSGISDSGSVVMLPPPTQEIVFIDDSIEEANPPLNTMDFMAEVLKADEKTSMAKLQEFEAKLIREQQKAATNVKMKEQQKPTSSIQIEESKKPVTSTNINDQQMAPNKVTSKVPVKVKLEQLTEQPSGMGNESTKLPEDFDMEEDDEAGEEEEIFPRPIVVKQEIEESLKEKYNIDCEQCEKFINFMSANMTDLQIREYLCNCRHFDYRELDHNTPPGFWNPHMVSFAEDDPRNEVHVDRRFVNQQKK